jgi:hypothetical protein
MKNGDHERPAIATLRGRRPEDPMCFLKSETRIDASGNSTTIHFRRNGGNTWAVAPC